MIQHAPGIFNIKGELWVEIQAKLDISFPHTAAKQHLDDLLFILKDRVRIWVHNSQHPYSISQFQNYSNITMILLQKSILAESSTYIGLAYFISCHCLPLAIRKGVVSW